MKDKINTIYRNQGWQLVIAALLSAVCFTVLHLTNTVMWVGVDDNEAVKLLSGYYTGTPSFYAPFVNAFSGYLFRSLYGITTEIPWYTLFYLFLLFVSFTVIFRFFLLCFSRKNIPIIVSVLVCVTLFFSVFTSALANMIFTTNSSIIGGSAIALLFIAEANSERKLRFFEYAISSLFMLISSIIRFKSSLPVFCFWGLSVVYISASLLIGKTKKSVTKKAVGLIALALAVFATSILCNNISNSLKDEYESEYYQNFNLYRSKYVDYTTASVYSDHELLDAIGWDDDVFKISKSFWFLDKNVNLDSLKTIFEETQASSDIMNVKERIFLGYSVMIKDSVGLSITIMLFILTMFILMRFIISKEKRKKLLLFLFCIFSVAGAFAMCAYLCLIKGRFLIHVYQTVGFPAAITLVIIAAKFWPEAHEYQSQERKKKATNTIISAILVVIAFASAANMEIAVHSEGIYKDGFIQSLESYAAENPQNFYIYTNLFDDCREFITFSSEKPKTNYMRAASCLTHSKAFNKLLELNGYNEFYSENMYDDNVYLVIQNGSYHLSLLEPYFNNHFGRTEMVQIYKNEYFTVYDVTRFNQDTV